MVPGLGDGIFEASPQCGLFSQLGYILAKLWAHVSPSVHGDGTGYLVRSLPGWTGCVPLCWVGWALSKL